MIFSTSLLRILYTPDIILNIANVILTPIWEFRSLIVLLCACAYIKMYNCQKIMLQRQFSSSYTKDVVW